MREFVKAAIRARHRHAALRVGEVRIAASGERWLLIERRAGEQRAVAAVNAGESPVDIDLAAVGRTAGLHSVELPGMAGELLERGSGPVATLPPLGAIALVDD
jgi:hypothetical protein